MRVLITGGSNGIGRATAMAFAESDDEICITYNRDEKSAQEVAKKTGTKIIQLDVTDDSSIERLKSELEKWKPEVIVNNAGVVSWKEFSDHEMHEIQNIMRINAEGAMKIAKVGVDLKAHRVINIGSGAAKHPYDNLPVYCASKAAIRMFSMAVGKPMILVNPGMTQTRMTGFQGEPPEKVADVIKEVAYGRIGKFGGEVDVWSE